MAPEQKNVVLAVIHTIIKFIKNDTVYVPIHATIIVCEGTEKSYNINTILTTIRNMTGSNAISFIGAPSGAATFNVQRSRLHHLLGIGVSKPDDNITQKVQDKLQSQLKNVLCLIIDKRSMMSSKVLGAAERNIQKQSIMTKIVKRSGEVYQQYSFLVTTTNYGRLLRKEQSKVILK
jgi:hypothetical protein